jgi:transposase
MPKPYSYDLRQKVMGAIESGVSQREAAIKFGIARSTINLWCQRQIKTGDYQAKPNSPPGNGHKITDWDAFREFVKANGDKTQAQMAKLWSAPISERTISRGLKKIGFTRKKNLWLSRKRRTKETRIH